MNVPELPAVALLRGRNRATAPHITVTAELVVLWITGFVSVLLPVLVWLDTGGPFRTAVTAVSAVLVPGVPVAMAFYPRRRRMCLALGPAVSLGVLVLVAVAQLLTGQWYPGTAASLVSLLGLAAVLPAARRNLPEAARKPDAVRYRTLTTVTVVPVVVCAASFGLWTSAVLRLDPGRAGSRGIITAVPPEYFAGLALLLCCALWLLVSRWDPRHPLHLQLGLLAAALTVQITTFVSFADGGAVVGTGYVHVGFVDAIGDLGRTLEGFDARFSWPGFFAAFAMLAAWAGVDSVAGLLTVYPAVVGILFIPVLLVLGRILTGSDRTAWGGVLVYPLVNWVQQDYFSPQSLAFLLYFTVVVVMLTETGGRPSADGDGGTLWRWLRTTPPRPGNRTRRGELCVEVLLLLLCTAMVVSHQLTPVALLTTLILFGATGVVRQRSLWMAVGVIFVAWFAFGARDWWSGNLAVVINGFGKSQEALSSGIGGRVQGDAAYRQMQQLRILFTAVLGLTAVAGWFTVRGVWRKVCCLLLVASPVSLVAVQTYGGEVVLRVVLYASPVLVVLTASAVAWCCSPGRNRPGRNSAVHLTGRVPERVRGVVLVAGALMVTVVGVAARGTNTAFERNPASTVEAARAVLDSAPAGSVVVPVETDAVLRMDRVGELRSTRLSGEGEVADQIMDARPDFVFFSSAREAYEHILHGRPADWFTDLVRQMVDSGDYEIFTRTDTATVLRRIA